VIAKNPTIP